MHPAGGNYNNLFMVIPKLPLPRIVKDFLLYNVDLHDMIWRDEYVARVRVYEHGNMLRYDSMYASEE